MSSNFKLKRISDDEEFEVSEISLLVGRSESCDIKVAEGHPSREHARVAERNGAVLVEDLHSTNGTFVNNKRIEVSTMLDVGDVVKFGGEAFSVQSLSAPEATVLMRSLGNTSNLNAAVIDEVDEEDADSTSFLEVYAMPPGWHDNEDISGQVGTLDERKKAAIDRYLDKFRQSLKGKTGLFLIFFCDQNPPVFKSLIVKDGKAMWSFGRSSTCDISFENPCISKHHADITFGAEGWFLEDNNSTNGVALDGSKRKKIQLCDHMILAISAVEVMVRVI